MNKLGLIITLLISCGFIHSALAQSTRTMQGGSSYWQCSTYDETNNQWLAQSPYQQVAINQAFDACKNSSQNPASCKAAKEYCELLMEGGVSTRPMWRCTAFDYLAQAWVGDTYLKQHDAAIGARTYCEERSGMGGTCYVNLLTCENLNLM